MKYCNNCKTEKNESEFGKNKSRHDGLTSNCRECTKYNLKNPKRHCFFDDTGLKKCSNCGETKQVSDFSKSKAEPDGRSFYCRDCRAESRKKYDHSEAGWITKTLGRMKSLSKRRGHDFSITKPDFIKWLYLTDFKAMHELWAISGRITDLKPSVDRKNDKKGYTFDNIQLITWEQNNEKGNNARKQGLDSTSKPVKQYDLEDNFIKEYVSACEAERQTGIRHIHECRTGKAKTAGGYIWR